MTELKLCFLADNNTWIPYPSDITEHFKTTPHLSYPYGNYLIMYYHDKFIQVKRNKCNTTCKKCSIYTTDYNRHVRDVQFMMVGLCPLDTTTQLGLCPLDTTTLPENKIIPQTNECIICASPYENKHVSNCGHVACKACWDQHLNNQRICFTCRKPVNNLIKIYD